MDGRIAIKCKASDLIEKFLNGYDIALYKHPWRDCIYEEYEADINYHKYEPSFLAFEEKQKYLKECLPAHSGLAATGIIIRRHTEAVKRFCETWWAENSAFYSSDQCNFMYAAFKHDLRINWISGDIYKSQYFDIHKLHKLAFPIRFKNRYLKIKKLFKRAFKKILKILKIIK